MPWETKEGKIFVWWYPTDISARQYIKKRNFHSFSIRILFKELHFPVFHLRFLFAFSFSYFPILFSFRVFLFPLDDSRSHVHMSPHCLVVLVYDDMLLSRMFPLCTNITSSNVHERAFTMYAPACIVNTCLRDTCECIRGLHSCPFFRSL